MNQHRLLMHLPSLINELYVSLFFVSRLKFDTHMFFPVLHRVSYQLPSVSIYAKIKQIRNKNNDNPTLELKFTELALCAIHDIDFLY